jgi:hypothetical protein
MKRRNPNEENRRRSLSQTLAALPRGGGRGSDLACLGWHCLAVRLP